MRVLLTGARGQLGRELQETSPEDVELTACDRESLDITDESKVRETVRELRPDWIINAAAYTAVDRAEEETDLAFEVNAEAPGILARAATVAKARLLHVSTDFVFNGTQSRPYRPDSEPDPLGVYGASKLAGDQSVLEISGDSAMILRTAWVYSRSGRNFVKTMLRLMAERDEISVVMDQIGSPTWARSLATVIWAARRRADLHGIYHWVDAGVASWYDFAVAIQEEAAGLGLLRSDPILDPVRTTDFATTARRPAFSVLDTSTTRRDLGLKAIHWRRQLRSMLHSWSDSGED